MHGREDTGPGPDSPAKRRGDEQCCSGQSCASMSSGNNCCGGGTPGAQSGEEVFVFTRDRIRELDRLAVEQYEMPSILLMENAARGIAGVVLEGLQGLHEPAAFVVCGPGNNGGDGLAVARHLHNRDVRVAIILAADASRYSGDALTNLNVVQKMGLPVFAAHVDPVVAVQAALDRLGQPEMILDALLGTGADRPARGPIGSLIGHINALHAGGCSVVAVDLPSGLDADTGEPCREGEMIGPCVEADLTVALAGLKSGFLALGAQKYVGELVVVDIGAPAALLRRLGTTLHQTSPGPQGP